MARGEEDMVAAESMFRDSVEGRGEEWGGVGKGGGGGINNTGI